MLIFVNDKVSYHVRIVNYNMIRNAEKQKNYDII